MKYLQPEFYHFNEDSIKLVSFVENSIQAMSLKTGGINMLDVCCGCGVIGIELAQKLQNIEKLQFVELQREFKEYLDRNIKLFLHGKILSELICTFDDFRNIVIRAEFDVVVANPPYFSAGQGRISPNKSKQMARTFECGSLEELVCFVKGSLKRDGKGFIIVRDTLEVQYVLKKFSGELSHYKIPNTQSLVLLL